MLMSLDDVPAVWISGDDVFGICLATFFLGICGVVWYVVQQQLRTVSAMLESERMAREQAGAMIVAYMQDAANRQAAEHARNNPMRDGVDAVLFAPVCFLFLLVAQVTLLCVACSNHLFVFQSVLLWFAIFIFLLPRCP